MIKLLRIPTDLRPFKDLILKLEKEDSDPYSSWEGDAFLYDNWKVWVFSDTDIRIDNLDSKKLPVNVQKMPDYMYSLKESVSNICDKQFNVAILECVKNSAKPSMSPHFNTWVTEMAWLDIKGSAPFEYYLSQEGLRKVLEPYFYDGNLYKKLFQSKSDRFNGAFWGWSLDQLLEIIEDSNFLYYYGDGRVKNQHTDSKYTALDKEYIGGFFNWKTILQQHSVKQLPFQSGQTYYFVPGKTLHNIGTALYDESSTYRLYFGRA